MAPDRAAAWDRPALQRYRGLGRAGAPRRRRRRERPVRERLQPGDEPLAAACPAAVRTRRTVGGLDGEAAVRLGRAEPRRLEESERRTRLQPSQRPLGVDPAGAVPRARRAHRRLGWARDDRLGRRDRNSRRDELPAQVPPRRSRLHSGDAIDRFRDSWEESYERAGCSSASSTSPASETTSWGSKRPAPTSRTDAAPAATASRTASSGGRSSSTAAMNWARNTSPEPTTDTGCST